ncbi:D-amino acid oxidase [Bordetella sp. H567]|uniref:FAD-dependent oxidoreductase n=1 Tax=Bordetella sp. H567 TaxID=1697043 RepID=UPI00081CBA58|nr:FAD-dependent oxidoreductase [Bordetella sp. H567]AOB31994.1 D-amino acid oxidase [Bordetella sp. H567]
MKRRQFLGRMGATVALSSAPGMVLAASCSNSDVSLSPIQARTDRITDVRVGLRPFRHAGPRIEAQRLGTKTVVHNYGHGGAGWSLSWGSSRLALRLAHDAGARSVAVIGCGAMGLTSAVLARQAGLAVCIYTKDMPSDVYSMAATGLWTPDSQLCDAVHAPRLAARWKEMANASFARYQTLLGLPGKPVEWIRGYSLSDTPFGAHSEAEEGEPVYGRLRDPSHDFIPRPVELCKGSHPFGQPYVRGWTTLMFNISAYAHMLLTSFLASGGRIKVIEFTRPGDLSNLREDTIINATGYGARKLFGDDSIVPIRGQIARLIPQPEVAYGLSTSQFNVVPRSDGLIVRSKGHNGDFNNSNDVPDLAESESAVRRIASMFDGMRRF